MKRRKLEPPRLGLIEVNYWTLEPALALEGLQSTGRIEKSALYAINHLVDLVCQLTRNAPDSSVDMWPIEALAARVNDGQVVDEQVVEAARAWVDAVRRYLRATSRSDYLAAVDYLRVVSEVRSLLPSSQRDGA